MSHFERTRDGFTLSTDPARLDLDAICDFLSRAYWASARPRAVIERSLRGSVCFGVYRGAEQVAFCRVISDLATFAWLCDVFVREDLRGAGLGKWMIECVVAHPDLQGLRRWILATSDAHGLYAQFGFTPLAAPEKWMERFVSDAGSN